MTSPEERIRRLAQRRAIDGADATLLLEAVRPVMAKTIVSARNPFARWSGEVTSLVGLAAALIGIGTSRLGVRYDGALDLHFGAPVPILVGLIDQIIVWPVVSLVFWIAARMLTRHARAIDVLGVVGASRAPYVIAALVASMLVPLQPADPTKGGLLAVVVLAAVSLIGLGIHLFFLFIGFRAVVATQGGRLAGAFVGGIVAAEVVTKLAIWSFRSFLVT